METNSPETIEIKNKVSIVSFTLYATLFFPLIGLLGWLSGFSILASLNEYFIPMAPSTGLCFILLVLPLVFILRQNNLPVFSMLAIVSALLVLTYSTWAFLFHSGSIAVSPDLLLFGELGTFDGKLLGHMAPSTAFLFIISAANQLFVALDISNMRYANTFKKMARYLGLIIALTGLFYTFSYAIDKPLFYKSTEIPMALTTALSFLLLGLSFHLMSNPHEAFFGLQLKKLRDVKIEIQMKIGFTLLLLLVIVLGYVSFMQTNRMHDLSDKMFQHPMQVQRAIGEMKADVLAIHRDMKDLFIAGDDAELEANLQRIEAWKLNVEKQLEIIHEFYLGPPEDVDSIELAFNVWGQMRLETIRLFRLGHLEEAANRTQIKGIAGNQVEVLLSHINRVDQFAKNKAKEFYSTSELLNKSLTLQLILLVIAILLLSFSINYILLNNIRQPLNDLTRATVQFSKGNFAVRSIYHSKNEFGLLTSAFNQMASSLETEIELNEQLTAITSLMLLKEEPKPFFSDLLASMAQLTGAQMAGVYLLDDEKKHYRHYDSIGFSTGAKTSFSAQSPWGEFGLALASGEVQQINNLGVNSMLRYETLEGNAIPRAIICIPLTEGKETYALLVLASVKRFKKRARMLCRKIHPTMSARVSAIIAAHKNREISRILEEQNAELEAQKTELSVQSSELIMQNNELEMQKKQLDEASRLKTIFLSNMSHELRTPLNSVIALSGVLNRRLSNKIPEEEHSYIEVIERNGKHLLELINDILDISRIEAGKEDIEVVKFNLQEVISNLAEMIRPQLRNKAVELKIHEAEEKIVLNSDPMKIRHILQNLIGNAVKFTEKGAIEISSSLHNNQVEIVVKDTGIGIAEEHLPHIFDEFRQADSSTSRKFGGTGLGLAIAKKYALMLGGNISVTSESEKGSVFNLILPLQITEDLTPTKEELSVQLTPGIQLPNSKQTISTILLVEDSEPAIIQLRDILDESKYNLMVARNGNEALELIKTTIPDAMLLDLMMPGVDGFKVLETIRGADTTANVPVLILTARHINKDELSFLKRNKIHQLIQKGNIQPHALITAIDSMLAHEVPAPKNTGNVQEKNGIAKILVVEDNPDNLLTVSAILGKEFDVFEASNGQMGVALAHEHKPDLILMDIQLPVMDGIQAFKEIRNNKHLQHIPIIALTASAMTSERETILAHGFDAYIAKPIDEKQFMKTLYAFIYGK